MGCREGSLRPGEPFLRYASSLCYSRGSARPLQRGHVGEEEPPVQPGEDPTQPLGLQRPPDKEGEAEGGPQGQEANLVEEGVWGCVAKWALENLVFFQLGGWRVSCSSGCVRESLKNDPSLPK